MPTLKRAPNEKELEHLRKTFLKAETDIINEIGRLRSKGLVDYHAVAALQRVQNILRNLTDECWQYVPIMIEKQFYIRSPETRKIVEPVSKHIKGYANAEALTATQHSIIDKLTMNLMGEITEANTVVISTLQKALIGRTENDVYRHVGLEIVTNMEATGKSISKTVPLFVQELTREGVTAFVDKVNGRFIHMGIWSAVLQAVKQRY